MLPFWQAQLTEAPSDARRDCGTCMKTYDATYRQRALGCGYEPRLPGRLGLWTPQPFVDEWNAQDPETRSPDPVMHCAGYTTRLPEVQEVAVAYPQYEAGYLTEFLGESPSAELLYACAVLKRADGAREADRIKRRSEEARHGAR